MCDHIPKKFTTLEGRYERCKCKEYCLYICMTCGEGLCSKCRDTHEHPVTVTKDHAYCSSCKKELSIESVSEFHKQLPTILPNNTKGLGEYFRDHLPKKMIILTGAGISTSAGIPDFRTPGGPITKILEKYNLDNPNEISDIDYFDEHPEPFFERSQFTMPGLGKFFPTPTHYFIRFLIEKGIVLKYFTQNIDGLDKESGIPMDKMIMCHGHFFTGHCRKCNKEYPQSYYVDVVREGKVPYCECGGVVKPDVVFFGQSLPKEFFDSRNLLKETDFLLVMGSSLVVYPFAALPNLTMDDTPRAFLNFTDVRNFEKKSDVKILGKTDDLIFEIVEHWGVAEEFRQFMEEKKAEVEGKYKK